MNKLRYLITLILLLAGCAPSVQEVESWKDLRDKNVVVQRYDFSCGTGSLATILNHCLQDEVEEKDLVDGILQDLSEQEIIDRLQNGLSMLDLKKIAEARGYDAHGVQLKPSSLCKINFPILVYLETQDYRHFAVFRGAIEDRVFLADPSRGNIRMPIHRFLKEWKGRKALIITKCGSKPTSDCPLSLNDDMNFRPELKAARNRVFH